MVISQCQLSAKCRVHGTIIAGHIHAAVQRVELKTVQLAQHFALTNDCIGREGRDGGFSRLLAGGQKIKLHEKGYSFCEFLYIKY